MSVNSAALVIFDLDGTVVDAFQDIRAALNHALALHGLPGHDIQTVRRFVGNGIVKLCERAVPADRHSLLPRVIDATRAYYAEHPFDHATIYAGIREALVAIRNFGCATALLSNKPDNLVGRIADHFAFNELFDAVAGEKPGFPLKPDPAAVNALRARFGASKVIVVGDGIPDGQVAANARAEFIGVTWGVATREELLAYGAVVDHAADIPPIVRGC